VKIIIARLNKHQFKIRILKRIFAIFSLRGKGTLVPGEEVSKSLNRINNLTSMYKIRYEEITNRNERSEIKLL